ncbi:hypothetical protein [Rhizobium sp. G21]|uniref:hypothetical protein n=1 Tax=Rhizobium sp. G21 TaxID=2758439 RepID=UPI001601F54A|nr:hypothetical protein [Rhizobium sp. G21]MBB1249136.1 hypothetical protein [Rhizobium sp. G21]
MSKRKPIRDINEYIRIHNNFRAMMIAYFHTKRGRTVDRSVKSIVFDNRPSLLYATNMAARKAVAIASTEVLKPIFVPKKQACYFVTVAFSNHVTSIKDGPEFDTKRIRDWAADTFSCFDFLGTIEAGYFTNMRAINAADSNMLSWHCHAIVWGIGRDALRDIRAATNGHHTTLRPDGKPFHFKKVGGETIIEQVVYMLKHAVNSYRIVPCKADVVDSETGEIGRLPTGKTLVKKRAVRQGEAVEIHKAFGERTIDELMIAGGRGKKLRKAILKRARNLLTANDLMPTGV